MRKNSFGERHDRHGARSSLHWKTEPASVETNRNLARLSLVRRDGAAVIFVPGAVTSRVDGTELVGTGGDGAGGGGGGLTGGGGEGGGGAGKR
jgi:hypothetical protein